MDGKDTKALVISLKKKEKIGTKHPNPVKKMEAILLQSWISKKMILFTVSFFHFYYKYFFYGLYKKITIIYNKIQELVEYTKIF